MENCVMCGGELMPMGQLGSLTWAKCRNCGAEQSVEPEEEDEEEAA